MSSFTGENRQRGFDDVKESKLVKEKLIAVENDEVPIFDDFEDHFAEDPETTKRPKKRRTTESPRATKKESLDPPPLSVEILALHKLFNLTNPGHMGGPVHLPHNLSTEIKEKIQKSREIYSFNEYVSRLIPLYRELPDIRPDYCRQLTYSENLPVTSVIMVFHNEPFTLIMRSVFAVFKRTPEELLGEIVLVDDCSDRGL